MKIAELFTRRRELISRMRTRWHLRGLQNNLVRAGVPTIYQVSAKQVVSGCEDVWFAYSFGDFGATGNIDFAGTLEQRSRDYLYSVVRPGDVFFDIGAHGGLYSLTLLRRFPELRVFSFEPLPDDLRANFELNGLKTDNIHAVALGEASGTAWITTSNRAANHLTNAPSDDCAQVMIVRLDDYAALHSLPSPDWIKIDVEGMELPALRGARRLLESHQPVVICEINHLFNRFIPRLEDLTEFMASLGYCLYRLTMNQLVEVPAAAAAATPADLGATADNNYWFVPTGHRLTSGGDTSVDAGC
jgi:FkbM family methyltransferase